MKVDGPEEDESETSVGAEEGEGGEGGEGGEEVLVVVSQEVSRGPTTLGFCYEPSITLRPSQLNSIVSTPQILTLTASSPHSHQFSFSFTIDPIPLI